MSHVIFSRVHHVSLVSELYLLGSIMIVHQVDYILIFIIFLLHFLDLLLQFETFLDLVLEVPL